MACDSKTSTIFLEAASLSWGAEEVSCFDPAAGLTGGESFLIASTKTKYQVWFSVDGAGVAPTPGNGETLVEVALPAAYTVADLIGLYVTAIEATGEFLSAGSSDGLSVETSAIFLGLPLAPLADVDTGFAFRVEVAGYGGDLGKTKEGIEVSFTASTFDVLSNQTAELILDQIIQSTGASLSAAILETTKERLELIFGNGYGDSYTPAGGTSLVGFGTSKQFKSSFDLGGKLILHPIRLDETDRSRDVVFHKTLALPESINYDGTDTQAVNVSFTALVDESVAAEISVFAIGDWTQDIRA